MNMRHWLLELVVLLMLGTSVTLATEREEGAKLRTGDARECAGSGEGGDAAELSVESGLNATGHWLAKVRLQHAVTAGDDGQQPVQLQLRRSAQRRRGEDGARVVTLHATLSGSSATSEEDLPRTAEKLRYSSRATVSPNSASQPAPQSCPPSPNCSTCPINPAPLPACPTCPSPPSTSAPLQCPSPCPVPPACPPCPSIPRIPATTKCPSPCATPPRCPSCPTCPTCPSPRPCPSPCATQRPCPTCPSCKKPLPPGYKLKLDNTAYRLHMTPLNWFDAKATCEREGAHLAIIDTQVDEANIKSILQESKHSSVTYVSLGFNDLFNEGVFYTVLDKPLSTRCKWKSGEPNNDGNEDCGGLYVRGFEINDHNCNMVAPFICELPLTPE